MWEAVCPVDDNHSPVVYESQDARSLVILNAGPDTICACAWDNIPKKKINIKKASSDNIDKFDYDSDYKFTIDPGIQRIVSGRMILVYIIKPEHKFAAIAFRILK